MSQLKHNETDAFYQPRMASLQAIAADVVAANVAVFRDIANSYDHSWHSVLGPELDSVLERDLEAIASSFDSRSGSLHCLDCGAGTGAITLRMLSRGWSVTAVDVSPEMLKLLAIKLELQLVSAALVNQSIDEFLAQPGPQYHLIGFNSVLHHIYDHAEIIEAAADRLAPGGFLYTNVDPVVPSHPRFSALFDSIDTAMAKLLHDPSDFIPGTVRRLKKTLRKNDSRYDRKVATPGDLAEFYARSGIDDTSLLRLMKAKGLEVREHSRYLIARTRLASLVNRFFKFKQEFKIIAQRPL